MAWTPPGAIESSSGVMQDPMDAPGSQRARRRAAGVRQLAFWSLRASAASSAETGWKWTCPSASTRTIRTHDQ
jgi:hypothetical protein